MAVSTTSLEYSRCQPKLGQVIRPYNAQKDPAARSYFTAMGVRKILKRNGQDYPGESTEGALFDNFFENGAGYQYLTRRNIHGAGHSHDVIDGHSHFMAGVRPVYGFNGRYGYRRNNPGLRQQPSTFGVVTKDPIH